MGQIKSECVFTLCRMCLPFETCKNIEQLWLDNHQHILEIHKERERENL